MHKNKYFGSHLKAAVDLYKLYIYSNSNVWIMHIKVYITRFKVQLVMVLLLKHLMHWGSNEYTYNDCGW